MPTPSDPRLLGAKCAECPYAKNGVPNRPVMGEGPLGARAAVIGESPGRDEVEQGRPFVGMTGEALDEEFRLAGLVRTEMRIVNAICCRPKEPKKENEMREAVNCCRPAFLAQVADVAPDAHWLTLGKWACYALTKKDKKMMSGRGFIRPFEGPEL